MRKEFEAFLLEKENFFDIEEIEREIVAKNETSFAIDFMRKERAGRITLIVLGNIGTLIRSIEQGFTKE